MSKYYTVGNAVHLVLISYCILAITTHWVLSSFRFDSKRGELLSPVQVTTCLYRHADFSQCELRLLHRVPSTSQFAILVWRSLLARIICSRLFVKSQTVRVISKCTVAQHRNIGYTVYYQNQGMYLQDIQPICNQCLIMSSVDYRDTDMRSDETVY